MFFTELESLWDGIVVLGSGFYYFRSSMEYSVGSKHADIQFPAGQIAEGDQQGHLESKREFVKTP